MENSFYFKISYFLGIQQYYHDIEHEINILLKKSYNHISIGMGLSKISSRIEATGFKTIPQFLPRGSQYAVWIPVGIQHDDDILTLDVWRSLESVFAFDPKTGHFERKQIQPSQLEVKFLCGRVKAREHGVWLSLMELGRPLTTVAI